MTHYVLLHIHPVHLRHVFLKAAICTTDLAKYGRPHHLNVRERQRLFPKVKAAALLGRVLASRVLWR